MTSKDLDQFYTKQSIATNCYEITLKLIKSENIKFDLWLEPSAGKGSFFNLLPANKVGIDLEPKSPNIILHDFLTYQLSDNKFVTIGNPPFGKNSSLAIKFFNKSAEKSALIAFIVPKTFKKQSVLKKLDKFFHLIYEEELPPYSFEFENNDYDVPCVFQVWKKQDYAREEVKTTLSHKDFIFTSKEDANYAIQRVGVNAGKLKEDFSICSKSSHYFIKSSEEVKIILQRINWNSVKYNTAGNPSISKSELIELYELEKIKS